MAAPFEIPESTPAEPEIEKTDKQYQQKLFLRYQKKLNQGAKTKTGGFTLEKGETIRQ